MRDITNTLLAAQTAASGRPHVRVEAIDMLAGVARTHFTRLYDGAEDSHHHAAAMPADGSLVRVRLSPGGALWVQRISAPGPASDFSAWTRLDTAAAACGVAACASGATVLVAFRDPANPRAVCVRESADSGRTWAERRVAATLATGTVDAIAAAFSAAGTPALFLAGNDGRLHVTTRTGGAWSAPQAHNYALASVTGLACDADTAWRLAITGADATGRHRLWTATYDGAWSSLHEVTRADAGSGVSFSAPFLQLGEVARLGQAARLTVVERYTGAGGYARPLLFTALAGTAFAANSWRDPLPLDAEAPYGLALTGGTGTLWLTSPDSVWRAALDSTPRDLSGDVLWLAMRESPQGGSVTVALRNDDGRYNAVGAPTSPIREGTELRVSPGYHTPNGPEVSEGPAFWVTGWERRYGGGEATLVVHAGDGWALLAAWRARRQFAWARGEAALASILGFILQRAGLGLASANPSAAMLAHRPAFTVHPGESGATAVRRLLAMAPDLLHFRGPIARLRLPSPSDAADYAFGSYHPAHHVRLAAAAPDATRVQVYGGAGVGEAFDWRAIPLLGERLQQVNDLNRATVADAGSHAADILARAQRDAQSGELQAPPNCGLEIHDAVAVHTPNGTPGTTMRVAALELDYRRTGTPKYQQKITLTGL